jgi:hypothetical protein
MQDPTSMDKGERRIVIHNTEKSPLGCTVRGGIEHGMGIFVADVNEDSMAEAVGLHNGDQIMSVNGVSFEKISHAEAIQVIKSSQSLILTIKSSRDVSLKGPMEPLETPISNPNVTFKAVKMPEKPEIALSPVTDTKPAAQIPTVFKAAPGLAPASVFVADGLPDTTNFKLFEPDNTSSFRMFDRKARDSIYSLVTTDDDTKQPIHQTPDITKPSQSTDMVTERPVSIPQTDTTKTEEINEVTPPEPPPLPTEEQLTTTEDETPSSTRGRRTETKQSSLFDVTYDSHLGMCTIPVTVTSHSKQEETGHQFGDDVIRGRQVKVVEVTQDMLLGVSIEGGTDTKHGGSILVKSIESNEAIKNQKTVTVGDQILMVHGQSMVDITHHEASIILKQAIETDRETISLLVAVETN